MKFMKYLMTLLAGLLTLAFLLTSCDSGSGEGETVDENAGQQITEGIVFVSYGDGTCYVDGVRAPFGTMNMELVIPEKSPEGDTVIEVRQLSDTYHCSPSIATQEYFEKMLQEVLKYFGGDEENIYYKKFKSYFQLKGLEFCSSDRLKEDLLAVYPLVEVSNIYVRDQTMFEEEVLWVDQIIWEACSYEIRLNDLKELIRLEEQLNGYSWFYEELHQYQTQKIAPCALKSVELPDTVTKIDSLTFYGCVNLTEVNIPDSVTRICSGAFDCCTGLTSITIPDSVMLIGSNAFWDCSSLTSIVLPNGLVSISDYMFRGCSSLASITIPDSVTLIGAYAFDGCTGLTNITLPNGVMNISHGSFQGCTGLTNIIVPKSVKRVDCSAFPIETTIYYAGTEEDWATIELINEDQCPKTIQFNYVPEE